MPIDATLMQDIGLKAVKGIMYGLIIIIIGIIIWYFAVEVKKKKWRVRIYQLKSDNNLHLVGIDILVEKKLNRNGTNLYILKKARTEVFPPLEKATYRFKGKEYIDYLLHKGEYYPVKDIPTIPVIHKEMSVKDKIKACFKWIVSAKPIIRGKEKNFRQLQRKIDHAEIMNLVPLEYDLNLMRQQVQDARKSMYEDKKNLLEKIAPILAISIVVMLVIVVVYLSYEYGTNTMMATNEEIRNTATILEKILGKMGGG